MYVIVVGCGRVGFHLTRALLAEGNEVVVIERDPRRAAHAADQLGSVVVASDGSEPSVLEEAGANRCDLLVATTGSDATNLVACQVGRRCFKVARTIAVVTDPEHVELFKSLGVDVALSTTDIILSHLEEEMPATGHLVHLVPLRGSTASVVGVRVPGDAATIGRPVRQIELPPNTALAALVREGQVRDMADDLLLEADDEVVVITPPDQEEHLWQALTRGA